MQTHANNIEFLIQFFLIPKRVSFLWRNRNRRKVTEALILSLKQRCDMANRANVLVYIEIYNVGLFIALLERDISTFNKSIFFAKSEWERQFFARGLAVLLYEGAEDIPVLLGKNYRESLKSLELNSEWFDELNKISAKLNQFRKANTFFLSELRNYVFAHRDHNASKQLDILSNLKSIEVYRLAAEFSSPISDLVRFYTKLLTHVHNPVVILNQVAKATPLTIKSS